jgi:hypothetical protein
MNLLKNLEAVMERPETLAVETRPEGMGRTGMLGYFSGVLGLFFFLRLQAAVPPGVLSFVTVLLLVLAANFFFAGVMHLFLDLTGAKGSASGLFFAFGCSDFLLALLLPLGFLAKYGLLSVFACLALVFLAVIYARVRLVRRLYPVSANKALLSIWLPYAGLSAVFFGGLLYGLIWLVWLAM